MTFPFKGITFSQNGEGTVRVGDGTNTGNNAVLDNESVTIPCLAADLSGKSFRVTEIGTDAFDNRDKMKSLWIPFPVVVINDYAFGDCDYLASITIESGSKLEYIGYLAFRYAKADITIPQTVTKIGINTFYGSTMGVYYCGTTPITNSTFFISPKFLSVTQFYTHGTFGGRSPTSNNLLCAAPRTQQRTPQYYRPNRLIVLSCQHRDGFIIKFFFINSFLFVLQLTK